MDMISAAPLFCAGITGKGHIILSAPRIMVCASGIIVLMQVQRIMPSRAVICSRVSGSPSLAVVASDTWVGYIEICSANTD